MTDDAQTHLDLIATAMTTPGQDAEGFAQDIEVLSKAALTPMDPTKQREWRDDLGALHIERFIPDIGRLEFFAADPGQWLTAKGQPAKRAKSGYRLHSVHGGPEAGIEMDRASKLTGCLDKPQLKRWMADLNVKGAVRAERLGELVDVHEDEWLDRVDFLGLGADAQRDAAAARGTGVHNILEALARRQKVSREQLPEDARPWFDGALAAWQELEPDAVEVEQIICHPEHVYAGRYDLVARIGGRLTLLDWKTSSRARVFKEAHYQARLYAMARERCGLEPVEQLLIVGIGPEGDYVIREGSISQREAEALLMVYRSNCRVDREMAA